MIRTWLFCTLFELLWPLEFPLYGPAIVVVTSGLVIVIAGVEISCSAVIPTVASIFVVHSTEQKLIGRLHLCNYLQMWT